MLGTVESVATGYISNLITSATARFVSAVVGPLKRRKTVDGSFNIEAPYSSATDLANIAITDLETVVGSYRGKLTTDVAALISEVARSGIPTAMLQMMLTGSDVSIIERTFTQLYNAYLPENNEQAKSLFNALHAALAAVLESKTKDVPLLIATAASASHLGDHLKKIHESLDQFLARKNPISKVEINDVIARLARLSQGKFKIIRVETKRGSREVEIGKIYVPARLIASEGGEIVAKDEPKKRSGALGSLSKSNTEAQINYSEFCSSFSRAVILGDPGGGKSTICQRYCLDLAKQTSLALQSPSAESAEVPMQKLPIRVVLRSFEKARIVEPQLDLLTFIIRDFLNFPGFELQSLRAAIESYLSLGQATVCFDGLDEILIISKRRDYVELISLFADAYPLCPILVTSRRVGYSDAPLPESFAEYQLSPFSNEEVEGYVAKFLKVCGGEKKVRVAVERAKVFMMQTARHASDLRNNPLMLGLMSWLFMNNETVPKNRPEIYSECALLMFEKWDKNRDIQANIPSDFNLLGLFSFIASHVYGDTDNEEGVSDIWLEQKLNGFFQDWYEEKAKARGASKALLEFIVGRAWVMSEIGPKVFTFTHRTFLEYFFARHLDDQNDTVESLMNALKNRIISGQQDVVCHLALQIKTYNKQNRIAQVVDHLTLTLDSGEIVPQSLAKMVAFAAAGLEYLPSTEKQHRLMIRSIVKATLSCLATGNFPIASTISECLRHASDRRELVESEIVAVLRDSYLSENHHMVDAVLWILTESIKSYPFDGPRGGRFIYYSLYRRAMASMISLPLTIVSAVRTSIDGELLTRSAVDVFSTRVGIEWGLVDPNSGFDKFGISAFFAAGKLGVRAFDHGLLASIVGLVLAGNRLARVRGFTNHLKYKELLQTIGQKAQERYIFELQNDQIRFGKDLFSFAMIFGRYRYKSESLERNVLEGVLAIVCIYHELILLAAADSHKATLPPEFRDRALFIAEAVWRSSKPDATRDALENTVGWLGDWVVGSYNILSCPEVVPQK